MAQVREVVQVSTLADQERLYRSLPGLFLEETRQPAAVLPALEVPPHSLDAQGHPHLTSGSGYECQHGAHSGQDRGQQDAPSGHSRIFRGSSGQSGCCRDIVWVSLP